MKRISRENGQDGLTLVELMVAVAILSILLSLGAPSLGGMLSKYRMRTAAHRLVAAMNLARIEAVSRNTPVTLCPVADSVLGSCGTDYAFGWRLFSNEDRDEVLDEGSDQLIHLFPALPKGFSVTNRLGTRVVADAVTWYPDGTARRNLSFQLCAPNSHGASAYSVVLNLVGRARVARGEGRCPGEAA